MRLCEYLTKHSITFCEVFTFTLTSHLPKFPHLTLKAVLKLFLSTENTRFVGIKSETPTLEVRVLELDK